MKKPRQIKINTFTYKIPTNRLSSSSARGSGNASSNSLNGGIKRGAKLTKKSKKSIIKAVKAYKKRLKAKEKEKKRLLREQKAKEKLFQRISKERDLDKYSVANTEEDIKKYLDKLNEVKKRVNQEYEIKKQINKLRANIRYGLKTFGDVEDYREKVEGYLEIVKDVNLKELDDKQLSSFQRNVSNMENWAKKGTYEQTLQKRVQGLIGYLVESETDFNVVNMPNDKLMEITTNNKTYNMTYKEVSDFWKMFRDLYDDVKLLRNYDKGMAGVATVLNLYQGKGIKDFDDLQELLKARYTLEKHEMLRREEQATKDIKNKIKMLR